MCCTGLLWGSVSRYLASLPDLARAHGARLGVKGGSHVGARGRPEAEMD